MKKVIVFSAILAVIFASCNASKSTSAAATLDCCRDAAEPLSRKPHAAALSASVPAPLFSNKKLRLGPTTKNRDGSS